MLDNMGFIQHLTDLRKRLIYVAITFVVMFAASFIFINRIFSYLVTPLTEEHLKLMVISPGEVITVYFTVGGFMSIGLSLPFVLYHLWKFVSPGLRPVERKYTLQLLPLMLIMFILGVLFAWFFIFPTILHFLIQLSLRYFHVMIRAELYFGFLTNICLPFGFIFELPIVVVFLTQIGLLTPRWLRTKRRYAYLLIVILGVFISPPELVSHLSVVLPMIALYEISILLSAITKRRRDRRIQAREMKEAQEEGQEKAR